MLTYPIYHYQHFLEVMDRESFSARLSIRVVGNGRNPGSCCTGDILKLIQEDDNVHG